MGGPLTNQDRNPASKTAPKVDESELPAHLRHRKRWCDEHGSPDDRDCTGCHIDHGDARYWSKRPAGAYKASRSGAAARE